MFHENEERDVIKRNTLAYLKFADLSSSGDPLDLNFTCHEKGVDL